MIWKALADPTRRTILNLLKKAPQTTGEISQHFANDLSRYAVMKHLGILEKANLITFKREGKYRWNYLNTKPIQQTYEQWVSKLMQLRILAGQNPDDMSQTDKSITTTTVFVETKINANRTRVWEALLNEVASWWQPAFNHDPKTKNFVLEAKLGGLMYEGNAVDQGLVWASVIGMEAPRVLQLKGHLLPDYGGPAISFTKLELETSGEQTTKLLISDTLFGEIDAKVSTDQSAAWRRIIEEGLKPYLEKQDD
jgi:DNA-binding transcriptional ArsR family regulator